VVKKRSSKERKAWYYQYLLTRDTAYKEIKTFDLGDYFRVKFEHILNEFIVQDKQLLRERSILTFLSSFIEGLVNTILFVYAVVKALE
jgi:ATP-binding cassette, subfamily B, bacterial NisT/SpaT